LKQRKGDFKYEKFKTYRRRPFNGRRGLYALSFYDGKFVGQKETQKGSQQDYEKLQLLFRRYGINDEIRKTAEFSAVFCCE
jgi:hypothetical protein